MDKCRLMGDHSLVIHAHRLLCSSSHFRAEPAVVDAFPRGDSGVQLEEAPDGDGRHARRLWAVVAFKVGAAGIGGQSLRSGSRGCAIPTPKCCPHFFSFSSIPGFL